MAGMTMKELAEVAGYTYRRLRQIEAALPEGEKLFVKGEDGKCDLATFVRRWVDYNVNKAVSRADSLEDVKAAHEAVKMRKTELEVEKMEGRLVDVRDVTLLWTGIAGTISQNLSSLPAKIAQRVAGVASVSEVAAIIEGEVRALLTELADTPLPDCAQEKPAADDGDDDDGEG